MFSLEHLLYMLIIMILIIVLHILIKKWNLDFNNFLKYAALISVTLDPIYWLWEYNTYGFLNYKTTLPLYICSMFWMLLPIVAFSKKQGIVYRATLSSLSTIVAFGAILGFVLNTHIDNYYFWHFKVQFSLFYHAFMICVIFLIWSTGYYQVKKQDKRLFFMPMLILMIPAFVVDKLYSYNYCYFNGGDGAILTYFCDLLGLPLFVIGFYALLFSSAYLLLSLVLRWQIAKKS